MSKTVVFDHVIYRIAHPVMQKLVNQARQAKEFQADFPHLYEYIKQVKIQIYMRLIEQLTIKYQEKTNLSAENIRRNVEKIIIDRKLLNHILGYCQTHGLYLADEYLIHDLLQHYEVKKIFDDSYNFFWEQIHEYKQLTDDQFLLSDFLPVYLKKNNYYLPNLFPNWDVEELFLDYLKILLHYKKFNNEIIEDNHPTYEDAQQTLCSLFKYDSPLPAYNKSFIDASSYDLQATSPEYLNLNIHLDEDPNNLPSLISDFLHHLNARKVDRQRKGFNTSMPINEDQFKKIYHLQTQIDVVVNASSYLKRPDTILTALISLIYYDQIFKRKILEGDPLRYQRFNYLKAIIDNTEVEIPNWVKETVNFDAIQDMPNWINRKNDFNLSHLMEKLRELVQTRDDFKISTIPQNTATEKIESIFCSYDGIAEHHKISKDSLKKIIPDTLKALSSKLETIISL
ncbi:hypothetical protein [Acinetobacter bouvetii]|uniref:Uncharacterized protein n=1 Tax=Acinetobacter bouvetii TaxID=202951 RepID=A0A811G5I5_9GAMM|nr:hypothetical protein [Acinetobacter bouvetii]CAB1207507.1 hypothetical protein SFB21_0160 [Acinetobacter bouvetii]